MATEESFTTRMRKATRNVHSISDKLVNSKLLLALSDKRVWTDALLIFYEIFKRLEEYKDERVIPELETIYVHRDMLRTAAFEADLAKFLGSNWKKNYSPRSEVVQYLLHLEELKEERPLLLLAYVYHLYMGLLSGGQIIRKKRQLKEIPFLSALTRSLQSGEGQADRVMEFPDGRIPQLKAAIKNAMNDIAAGLTQEQRYALTNESQMVFIYNNGVVKSIRGTNKAILWKVLYVSIAIQFVVVGYYCISALLH